MNRQDKSYINGSDVHSRIKGRRSCGVVICGGTNDVDGCKGRKHSQGRSATIHRSVGINRSVSKGDGD